ncbi:MAG: hypothetical protein M1835_003549, partial [Candelina submexicana]
REKAVKDRIATLRIFSEVLDLGEEIANGQLDLGQLLHTERHAGKISNAALGWIMLHFKDDIRGNMKSTSVDGMLWYAAWPYQLPEQTLQLLLGCFKDRFDEANRRCFSILHYRILDEGFKQYDTPSLKLLGHLSNLHLSTEDVYWNREAQTPTSLAMRNPYAFQWWKHLLRRVYKSSASDFVLRELDEAPLRKSGWKVDTLLALFQFDLDAEFRREGKEQRICARCGYGIKIYREAWWDIVMINIKHRREPYDSWSDNGGRELLVAYSSYNYYTGQGQDPDVYEICDSCLRQKEDQPEMFRE